MCPPSTLELSKPSMQAQSVGKDQRVSFRVSSETKSIFERAASFEGRTMTDFVVAKSREAAIQTISEHEKVVLNESERLAFFDALLQSHPPSAEARTLAQKSKEMFGE